MNDEGPATGQLRPIGRAAPAKSTEYVQIYLRKYLYVCVEPAAGQLTLPLLTLGCVVSEEKMGLPHLSASECNACSVPLTLSCVEPWALGCPRCLDLPWVDS